MAKNQTNNRRHFLILEHTKLTEKEKQELYDKYNISFTQLPNISIKDPGLDGLDVEVGDVIKIIRPSSTKGESEYYRGVVND